MPICCCLKKHWTTVNPETDIWTVNICLYFYLTLTSSTLVLVHPIVSGVWLGPLGLSPTLDLSQAWHKCNFKRNLRNCPWMTYNLVGFIKKFIIDTNIKLTWPLTLFYCTHLDTFLLLFSVVYVPWLNNLFVHCSISVI